MGYMSESVEVGWFNPPDLQCIQVRTGGRVRVLRWGCWPKVRAGTKRLCEFKRCVNLVRVFDRSRVALLFINILCDLEAISLVITDKKMIHFNVSITIVPNLNKPGTSIGHLGVDICSPSDMLSQISWSDLIRRVNRTVHV